MVLPMSPCGLWTGTPPPSQAWQPAADQERYLHIADSAHLHTDTETRWGWAAYFGECWHFAPRSFLCWFLEPAASPAAAAFIQNFKLYLRVTNDNKVILVCEAPGGFRWQWMKTKSVWLGLLMFLIIFNNVIKWQIEKLLFLFVIGKFSEKDIRKRCVQWVQCTAAVINRSGPRFLCPLCSAAAPTLQPATILGCGLYTQGGGNLIHRNCQISRMLKVVHQTRHLETYIASLTTWLRMTK